MITLVFCLSPVNLAAFLFSPADDSVDGLLAIVSGEDFESMILRMAKVSTRQMTRATRWEPQVI